MDISNGAITGMNCSAKEASSGEENTKFLNDCIYIRVTVRL